MDKTKQYYYKYLALEEEMKEEAMDIIHRNISLLESDLMNAWECKDIDKIINVSEILESHRLKAKGSAEIDRFRLVERCWNHIYEGTRSAWFDGYSLASDDIAYYLSQSTQWVARELEEKLDYVRLIKPSIYFSLNFSFSAKQQQYYCRKKYLYNINSFKSLLKSKLKEVDSVIHLNIQTELTKDEEILLLELIEELKKNAPGESDISDDVVDKIINKDIELLNISAIKDKYLREQVKLNADRMKKKLYWAVKHKLIKRERKVVEEREIEHYANNEFDRLKNTTTVYNQQVYRYLDSVQYTKYYFYFNDDKKPLVLYSIDKKIDSKYKYFIPKSLYKEGIEDVLLSKVKEKVKEKAKEKEVAKEKKSNVIDLKDRI